MIFRIRYETRGGHVHMRVFSGRTVSSLGKCGDLCMRVDEFEYFQTDAAFIHFLPEAKDADRGVLPIRQPSPGEIAADWFTLPPSLRTKAKLLEMLS